MQVSQGHCKYVHASLAQPSRLLRLHPDPACPPCSRQEALLPQPSSFHKAAVAEADCPSTFSSRFEASCIILVATTGAGCQGLVAMDGDRERRRTYLQ